MTPVEDFIAYEIVPFGAVAASGADETMIAIYVHDSVAQRASQLFREEWTPDPSMDHGFEQ